MNAKVLSEQTLDLSVPVTNCRLWSPEDPFLYEIVVRTTGDEFITRFGMREFKIDPVTGHAMLNGKTYFMRGSNFTLYRFFEDPERGNLLWDEKWVRKLHQRVKDMHWNSLRYCIGFPPEFWYRIADEEGILIQDEFPIWYGRNIWPKELKSEELVTEYTEWMQERWNHPCIAIWDANNETTTDQTIPAIKRVRSLDMSNRPWDNSYVPTENVGDILEMHPYHFNNSKFKLADIAKANTEPWDRKGHGTIVNEYGWLWLNRDGTPTTLTKGLYLNLLGPDSTTEKRRQVFARYTAAETEFWRSHRKMAGVLEFCSLGYSRFDGQTSDHWLDIKNLKWEPEFYRYVRQSFAPVGIMIDAWAADYAPGKMQEFPVTIINDLNEPWKGDVRFRLLSNGKPLKEKTIPAQIAGLGSTRLVFTETIPEQEGNYQIEATLMKTTVGTVSSLRNFVVMPATVQKTK